MEKVNFNLDDLSSNIKTLFKLYDNRCTPPDWILNPTNLAKIRECMFDTIVYYDSSDNYSTTLDNVKFLMSHREPVNIACNRYYNKQGMMETYGYDESLYGSLPESVNVAAFTRTIVKPAGEIEGPVDDLHLFINLLNVYTPAFDSPSQPDCRFFEQTRKNSLLKKRFALVFKIIFECAIRKNMKSIMLSGFGLGAFKNRIEDYIGGLKQSYEIYKDRLANIKLVFCDYSDSTYNRIKSQLDIDMEYKPVNYYKLWFFIEEINNSCDISRVLFINAWDMHSILGNGHFSDDSWDGHYGRRTAISILAFPWINPFMQYVDLSMGDRPEFSIL